MGSAPISADLIAIAQQELTASFENVGRPLARVRVGDVQVNVSGAKGVSHYLFFSIRVNCIEPAICRSLLESDSAPTKSSH
jgi:hypothetical protein